MASVVRFSRFGKVAALSALGGSFYLFRDEIKPYLGLSQGKKNPNLLSSVEQHGLVEQVKYNTIENLPEYVPYLLIGGGTASHSAMKAIRAHDPKAKVVMVTSENRNSYMRPALSKELWFTDKSTRRDLNFRWWNGKEKNIHYEIDEFYIPIENLNKRESGGVSLIKNTRITKLEPDVRLAHLDNGQTIKYGKCLLAPGGKPKFLPVLDNASTEVKERIIYFRTADDFLKLDKCTETAKSIAIIGGGFLGSELTYSLVRLASSKESQPENVPKDQTIYQIYPESGILPKVLPKYLSEWLAEKVEKEGAKIKPKCEVVSVSMKSDKTVELILSNGEAICADYIVCAVGLEPDVELAKSSQLKIDEKLGGFLVNSQLEATQNIWVAGDASSYDDVKLGRRRVEHHDHAINSGKLAGQNMTGAGKPLLHQSMFWSDLGPDIALEGVGIIDSNLPTVAVFTKEPISELMAESSNDKSDADEKANGSDQNNREINNNLAKESIDKFASDQDEKYGKGVIFYLKDNIVIGVVLWNTFGRLSIARRILNDQKKYDDFNELAKLFNVYLDD